MPIVSTDSALRIEVLGAAQEAAYTDFIAAQPDSLLYATLPYRDMVMAELGCEQEYLIATVDGEIVGALPLMYTEAAFGRVYNSLPYYGSHGGLVTTDAAVAARLAQAYGEILRRSDTAAATVIENPFTTVPLAALPHTHRDRRISQCTTLPRLEAHLSPESAEEAVLASVDSSARRNVKRARRDGVTVTRDAAALPALYQLHAANLAAVGGLAKSAGFFDRVPQFFDEGRGFDCWVAYRDGALVAGLLVFYYRDTVDYFTPAIDAVHRASEPLALVLAAALTDAARRGLRHWNWGGTWLSQDGVYRFKHKWGARDRSYEYLVQVNRPALLAERASTLRALYPGFYVAPYDALCAPAGAA